MNENESLTENSTDQDDSKPGRSVSISVKILAVTLGTTIIVLTVSGIVAFMMSRNAIVLRWRWPCREGRLADEGAERVTYSALCDR